VRQIFTHGDAHTSPNLYLIISEGKGLEWEKEENRGIWKRKKVVWE